MASALVLAAAPAVAGVDEAVNGRILPGVEAFATVARALADTAAEDCVPEALHSGYQAAFDAWMPIADLRLGPSEQAALSIAFWPDDKRATPRALSRLISAEDPVGRDPAAYAEVSIAARGLFALDRMLYDSDFSGYADGSYSCALTATIAEDLARQAEALRQDWADHAALLREPGASGNTTYLTEDEAARAIYTQLLSALEFTADVRLGNPMGTLERPRPGRAEAWRSGRSLPDVIEAIRSAVALAEALAGRELPKTRAAAEHALEVTGGIGDPGFQDIEDPAARFRLEVLDARIRLLYSAIEEEVGTPLGIAPGFNALDGD